MPTGSEWDALSVLSLFQARGLMHFWKHMKALAQLRICMVSILEYINMEDDGGVCVGGVGLEGGLA